jgi:hypothetical protein
MINIVSCKRQFHKSETIGKILRKCRVLLAVIAIKRGLTGLWLRERWFGMLLLKSVKPLMDKDW